jgi:hypothetical protein
MPPLFTIVDVTPAITLIRMGDHPVEPIADRQHHGRDRSLIGTSHPALTHFLSKTNRNIDIERHRLVD